MLAARLGEAMKLRGMTSAELHKATGIQKANLLEYLLGEAIPGETNLIRMANALKVNEMWLEGKEAPMEQNASLKEKNITIAKAANMLGKSEQFVRIGLQRGLLPFGVAVKRRTQYNYYISPDAFERFVKGVV